MGVVVNSGEARARQPAEGRDLLGLAGSVVNREACGPLKGQIIKKSHVGLVSTGLISQAKLDIEILL